MIFNSVPPELAIQVLVSDALLVLSICSAKYWLLARGVGSLWLSINVLAGGGLAALVYLVIKGRIAVRGDFPVCNNIIRLFNILVLIRFQWKTLVLASGTLIAQQIALFYSLKRLDASRWVSLSVLLGSKWPHSTCESQRRNNSMNILLTASSSRILFIAPFSALLIRHIIRTHSLRSTILSVAAISVAILIDANFSITDLHKAWTAYLGLLINGLLQVASHHTSLHLNKAFEHSQVLRAMTVLTAAAMTIPIHLLGRAIGLLPPYPFVPILALTPLPLLAFVLLYYHPTILSSSSSFSLRGTFQLAFIPTALLTCIMAPLFSRTLTLPDIPLAIIFFYVLRPSNNVPGSSGMGKSASEPVFRLLQGYLNTILSNPESRKIFYFLVVNMAYMLVQMLYGVWTNSLGLISDGKCLYVSLGIFINLL
jgi:solute carrier family 30 (zinc transporter), member 5/7